MQCSRDPMLSQNGNNGDDSQGGHQQMAPNRHVGGAVLRVSWSIWESWGHIVEKTEKLKTLKASCFPWRFDAFGGSRWGSWSGRWGMQMGDLRWAHAPQP